MQDNSAAVAVPQPSADGDEVVSYQTLVFGMLELKKQFPEDARRRGVSWHGAVAFELERRRLGEEREAVASSGDAALDVESSGAGAARRAFPQAAARRTKILCRRHHLRGIEVSAVNPRMTRLRLFEFALRRCHHDILDRLRQQARSAGREKRCSASFTKVSVTGSPARCSTSRVA